MTREEIQKEMDQLSEAKEEVLFQLEKATGEKEQAEAKIEELNGRLSALLAGNALKRIPSSKAVREIVQVKREKSRLNRVIEDYPFLKAGLEGARKVYSQHRFEVLTRKNDRWNEYDRLKAEILANPHDRHHDLREGKLLRLAAHPDLDCLADAKAFLKGVR